ncbi:MAG TPA: hypothetical protein VI423_06600 [Paenisporosarcina sp.]|nr:hypothetical protein [Paenisporosarcina sp.]
MERNIEYDNWIQEYRIANKVLRGFCWSASKLMQEKFHELKQERGYVITEDGGWHQHWWCVAPDGQIYDPTVTQFGTTIIRYEPYDEEEHGPLPTGKCLNCSELIFNGKTFCDENCEKSTLDYLKYGRDYL